jgi:dTDP-glucose 4,6-dehydratase
MPEFRIGLEKTVDWYLTNSEWLNNVLSGEYEKYYENMYSKR